MSDVLVDYKLLEKVRQVHEPIEDDAYEIWKHGLSKTEQIRLTRIAKMCDELTELDFAAISIIAVRKHPDIVLKAILDELKEGDKK